MFRGRRTLEWLLMWSVVLGGIVVGVWVVLVGVGSEYEERVAWSKT